MRSKALSNTFFSENRKKLTHNIIENSIVLLFSPDEYHRNGDQFYYFRQNSNLYHLCGINQEESILMFTVLEKKDNVNEILFIKEVNNLQRIWNGEKLDKDEASKLSGISNVQWNSEFDSAMQKQLATIDNIYFHASPNLKSFDDCPTSNMRRINLLKSEYPEKNFIEIDPLMEELRLIKQDEEIVAIKKAVEITRSAYDRVLKSTKAGKFEYEIEAEITYDYIRLGAEGHAYMPIVASGINACILHYIDNNKQMKDGDLLLLDFGAEYSNYAADCSRTIPINGKFSQRQKECYNAVLDVYKRTQKLYVPGNTINIINEQVGIWMQEKMVELGLFTQADIDNHKEEEPIYKRYFMHGTAHFIGLDVHDVGSKSTIFKEGMLLSCEPAIYIEQEGIGIRIETDIIVGNKPNDLMADFPLSVDEIEEAMITSNT